MYCAVVEWSMHVMCCGGMVHVLCCGGMVHVLCCGGMVHVLAVLWWNGPCTVLWWNTCASNVWFTTSDTLSIHLFKINNENSNRRSAVIGSVASSVISIVEDVFLSKDPV